MTTRNRQLLIRGLIFAALAGLVLLISRHAPQPFGLLGPPWDELDGFEDLPSKREEIKEKIARRLLALGPYSSAVFILIQVVQVVISPIPGDVIGMVAGYVYGKAFGFVLSVIGVAFGSWVAFELARILGRPFTQRFVKREILEKFDFVTTEMGVAVCFLLFLIPYFPKDSLCYVLGLSRMGLGTFLIMSTIGRMPGIYMQVVVGASIQKQEYAQTIVIAVLCAAALFLTYLYRARLFHWIKNQNQGD
jgi:uncharacterized membrane protein YdjX (TVP38/TMEM64 family)